MELCVNNDLAKVLDGMKTGDFMNRLHRTIADRGRPVT